MTNIPIFGKDAFRVDIIGTWLAGHEPGNGNFLYLAEQHSRFTDFKYGYKKRN